MSKVKIGRKILVNRKREEIFRYLRNQRTLNLSAAARATRSDIKTVKKVYDDLVMFGHARSYEYNNIVPAEQIEDLHRDIDTVSPRFLTTTDLKRLHPRLSKKRIRKELHSRGFHWDRLARNRKNPKKNKPNPKDVFNVIAHVAQCLNDPTAEMLYLDEFKLPLVQTPERYWSDRNPDNVLYYNRRDSPDISLTAIALCSTRGFEAVQIFQNEINGTDFLHFLDIAVARLPAQKRYSILADNATWHSSQVVQKSKAYQFLAFNVAGMYQLNLIETAFSYTRNSFRKRQSSDNLEEEASRVSHILFDERNGVRFDGFYRNHLRSLLLYLEKCKQHGP